MCAHLQAETILQTEQAFSKRISSKWTIRLTYIWWLSLSLFVGQRQNHTVIIMIMLLPTPSHLMIPSVQVQMSNDWL